jgi:PiT family inorganic phosphate transporter
VPPNVALVAAAILNVVGALVSTHVAATLARGIVQKVLIPTLAAPIIGFGVGIALMVALLWSFQRAHPARAMRRFRRAQLASASLMAFSHGSNDAQKTMGVITLALFAGGAIGTLEVPLWVKLVSALVMGLGTYVGGKRIIRTLGARLVKLTPLHGFAADPAASGVLLGTAYLGFPISTTHVITAGVMGVGASERPSAVRWGLSRNILIAWLITLPMSGLIGAGCALAARSLSS